MMDPNGSFLRKVGLTVRIRLAPAESHANSRIGMLTDLKTRPRDNRGQRLIAAPRQIQILPRRLTSLQ